MLEPFCWGRFCGGGGRSYREPVYVGLCYGGWRFVLEPVRCFLLSGGGRSYLGPFGSAMHLPELSKIQGTQCVLLTNSNNEWKPYVHLIT